MCTPGKQVPSAENEGENEVLLRKSTPIEQSNYPGFNSCDYVLPKGSVQLEGAMPLGCDILVEQDVAVKLRDGVCHWHMICPGDLASDVSAVHAARVADHEEHGFLLEGRHGAGDEGRGSDFAGDGEEDHLVAGGRDHRH